MLKNTQQSYGAVSKSFHWIMALMMIGMLCVGFFMGGVEDLTTKLKLYGLHKSVGVLILTLVTLRILWHLASKRPPFLDGLKPWEKMAAHLLHFCLYGAMIGMPLSGWLMSSAAGRAVQFFGLFTLPDLVAKDEVLREIFGTIHFYMAWALILAIVAHAGAALKHHFISKDGTLRRMLPVLVLLTALAVGAPATAEVTVWNVSRDSSTISFSGSYMGKEFTGTFGKFTTDIAFSPEHLGKSHARAEINLASVETGDDEKNSTAKGTEWFDIAHFPVAKFESTAFRKTGENTFVADGNLTIKALTLPVSLPFTLVFSKSDSGKESVMMSGTLDLDRSKFQLGQGEWADTSVIGNQIRVSLTLRADSAAPAVPAP